MISSKFIEQECREYAIYVLQNRALPSISDGLKIAARRLLWVARNGEKFKTASLSGSTMCLHPHAAADGVIISNTGKYVNNIPLFEGMGSFGSRLSPNTSASPRYTAVKISKFTEDVVFKDLELVEMIDNYDQTLKEPLRYYPLIPVVLLNQADGIGLGFASSILPRSLSDIIGSQIEYLSGKVITQVYPEMVPIASKSYEKIVEDSGKIKWLFKTEFERLNSYDIKIDSLPYGMSYDKFIQLLNKFEESGYIRDYSDSSSEFIDIVITFPQQYLNSVSDEEICKKLKLVSSVSENLTILDFDGVTVIKASYEDIISRYSDYRLGIYVERYHRLLELLRIDIQKYTDVIKAIDNEVGKISVTMKDKTELVRYLKTIDIVNTEYISSMAVYRFTKTEKNKIQKKLDIALQTEIEYSEIINSDAKRLKIYISELKEVLKNYKKSKYQ